MPQSATVRGMSFVFVLLIFASRPARAGNDLDIAAIRHDIEAIKAAQQDIRKDLLSLTNILTGKQPPLDNVYIDVSGKPALGNNDARVSMLEFSDFQCPFCGAYARETLPRIVADYVNSGRVRYVVLNFPLEQPHPFAEKAAEAALCAQDQGRFWQAHDRFFADPQKLSIGDMPGHAAALGLDASGFMDCIKAGRHAAAVERDRSEGETLGVQGTPTFFIGTIDPENRGRVHALRSLVGNVPLREFQKAIEEVLAESEGHTEAKR